ncbi:hypothetical protein LOAG_11650 [Loa loa]|uniref:Uncharacterized protein n=1 Tax=Loa loa TaxID=7209 RepID=A0A1S0TP47_LOALO|nr:hypothetical protein LOAG_11650 [Loa loa]EFO16854.1 hypothetical protein LOAG_11650 [Loa loa]
MARSRVRRRRKASKEGDVEEGVGYATLIRFIEDCNEKITSSPANMASKFVRQYSEKRAITIAAGSISRDLHLCRMVKLFQCIFGSKMLSKSYYINSEPSSLMEHEKGARK